MSILAVTSAMLIVGINRFNVSLMYPTLLARMLLIIFVQVFGVSTVVAPHRTHSRWESYREKTEKQEPESNVALRLVMLVFAMLIITVIVLYCIYLVVRCIQYVKYYCRMKERRDSLIQASMIHPDAGSRRTSSLA
uniref:G_PROTEIN_RECEP_F3_4 domain-containing protein n=1 Tax=Angiostrongylus cantonensis TaxID=6313 RepID=A0A0K0DCZ4_ANGCA